MFDKPGRRRFMIFALEIFTFMSQFPVAANFSNLVCTHSRKAAAAIGNFPAPRRNCL